ncbi:COG1216 Predicted glycosyltransferases [uncultured Caudovirales phage]|uniref:COG1216 Predicted glycosyltransferases n=1 Tax=uncultured Caudovirales phage TaxID=2100421 RepID=A0A6J5M8M3_9CAUD|nr:COG1216 Predicted glycosyltransferases [uncultured Caudovirales phage]
MNISLIIPSYNNLQHLKNVYASIKKHAPSAEVVLLDDGSTDGTWEWICAEAEGVRYRSPERVGHTILYDKGIELATNEVVGIMHADMILGPNYVENLIKHLEPGTVVCATRIEPPLHPPGKEKIIQDFGQDFNTLDIKAFEEFCNHSQQEFANQTTKGMFAPWILHKKDFQAIGGHDPLFAPFPYEDSDIFQRWILAGYKLVQSRDAFVYHLTCRGHRWNEQVGKDDDYYKVVSNRAARNYIRKWGSWIKNDEYQCPVILPKYDIGYIVTNCGLPALEALEPWCSTIYIKDDYDSIVPDYIKREQPNTLYDLQERIRPYDNEKQNNILISFDAAKLTPQSFHLLQQLPEIIKDNGSIGAFELDVFTIDIVHLNEYQETLIKL